MSLSGGKKVIYAALFGNGAITVMKFGAAFFSGSAAMLAEAFHSTADTANQLLLLFGLARSQRPPDDKHPFGYGKEVYFWSFIVAVSVFFVGAAFSIYEGVHKVLHPEPVESIAVPLAVLGAAVVFELYAFTIAYREARTLTKRGGIGGLLDMAVATKNPPVMVVLLEDSAALVGLVVAACGITAAYYLNMPVLDGVTGIVIGILLLFVAYFLARETKALLIGESATVEDREAMTRVLSSIPEITRTGTLMTMHLGPEEILVNLDVEFRDGLSTDEVEAVIDKLEHRLKQAVPAVKKIYIEAESIMGHPKGV